MNSKSHWQNVYTTRQADQLGWYAPHLTTSLKLIRSTGVPDNARIIDIGGGASTLVDDLLESGFVDITVVDLAIGALDQARARLGDRAPDVQWIEADITKVRLPTNAYDIWHDRAVFHFLTEPEARARYVRQMQDALKPGGHIIIATFAPEAPPKCSGLSVQRYAVEELHHVLGHALVCVERSNEVHVTPGGISQMYLYCHFRKPAEKDRRTDPRAF